MQLAPGTYTFTTTAPTVTSVTYVVGPTGVEGTFGTLLWNGTEYRRGGIAIEILDGSHFVAINGPENLTGVYVKVA